MRSAAERAGEWYLYKIMNCLVVRRAVKTQWQKVDFFGSDLVGKKADGTHIYVQVTAGEYSAVTARRRKLEKIPWHESDTVQILQLIQRKNPANARRKNWFFRVHVYQKGKWITLDEAIEIKKEWFKKINEKEINIGKSNNQKTEY